MDAIKQYGDSDNDDESTENSSPEDNATNLESGLAKKDENSQNTIFTNTLLKTEIPLDSLHLQGHNDVPETASDKNEQNIKVGISNSDNINNETVAANSCCSVNEEAEKKVESSLLNDANQFFTVIPLQKETKVTSQEAVKINESAQIQPTTARKKESEKHQFSSNLSSDSDDSSDTESDTSSTVSSNEEPETFTENLDDLSDQRTTNPTVNQVSAIFKELLLKDEDSEEPVLPSDVQLEKLGTVTNVIEGQMVLIKAIPDKPALDLGTLLFLENKKFVGKILETFGPVASPFYIVCPKNSEGGDLVSNQGVYFVPNRKDITSFIFTTKLRESKGSDASWLNDQEPPQDCLDYSDDEAERNAKQQKRNHRKRKNAQEGKMQQEPQAPKPGDLGGWHNQSLIYTRPPPAQTLRMPRIQGPGNNCQFNNFNPWLQQRFPHHNIFLQPNNPPPLPQLHNVRGPPLPPHQSFYP